MNKIRKISFSPEIIYLLEKSLPIFEKMLEDRKYIPLYNGCPKINIIDRMSNREYETPSKKLAIVIIASCTGDIKSYTNYICNDNYETIICVYTNNINISHKKMEKTFKYKIEIWPLIFTHIADHILQPKIEIVDKKEMKFFLSGDVKIFKLPKISYYDPLIRYFRIPHKSVVKITDNDNFISYRVVI